MSLFGRIVEVAIGPTTGAPAIRVRNLRVSFKVSKTSTSEPNSCEVTVTNLSEQSRERIRKVDDSLVLSAGYSGEHGAERLFSGNITNVVHSKEPPDVHTTIECGDGQKELRTVTSLSYTENSTLGNVLRDIAHKLGLPVKTDLASLGFRDATLGTGFSFVGPAREALDGLADQAGLEWSVQGGEIKFTLVDKGDATRAIRLTSDSGLIGHPQRLYAKKTKTGKVRKGTFDGWKVACLLQPKAEPGGIVEIESASVPRAQFKIVNVDHAGDTHGNVWNTMLEVREQ